MRIGVVRAVRIGPHYHQVPELHPEAQARLRPTFAVALTDGGGGGDAAHYARYDNPDLEWLLRDYEPDVMAHPPEGWAGHVDGAVRAFSAKTGIPLARIIVPG